MSNGASSAVQEATHLNEIGFTEFTTKLITDVFDALVSSNIRQMEAFSELLAATAKSLTDYINDTADQIDGAQILQFLAAIAPEGDAGTKIRVGGKLEGPEATEVGKALTVPGQDPPTVPTSNSLTKEQVDTITAAVARRIAANKYDSLQEMVRMGLLRLVVESGTIETKLTFNTYTSSSTVQNAKTYKQTTTAVRAGASTGFMLAKWVNASASASRNSVTVSSTSRQDADRSGSSVQIFGGVKINFKTDFLPLNA
jgi:hypothetical protein